MALQDEALAYRRRGWSIIPIRHGTKEPACGRWKPYQTQRANDALLAQWFGGGKPMGLAVVLGEVSGGLVCRDFDDMAAYERWAAEHVDLAQTLPTVETGRPGRHVYVRADIAQIQQHSKTGGAIMVLADGEVRGGGYCLLPPSIHPSGATYRWIVPPDDEIPKVDLISSGLLPCNREDREAREYTGGPRGQKTLGGVGVENTEPEPCPLDTQDSQDTLSSQDSPYTLLHGDNKAIEAAIRRTLPTGNSQRHKLLFELARELKALPALVDAPLAALKPIVRQWHRRAVAQIRTKAFEESWFDFCDGWDKVKFAKGEEPMALIVAKAMEAEMPEVAKQYEQRPLQLLVAVCRELQRASGEGPFFLSVRTAGKYLGVTHVTASRWLRGLQHDGILQLVVKGSQSEHKASRYRYLAGM